MYDSFKPRKVSSFRGWFQVWILATKRNPNITGVQIYVLGLISLRFVSESWDFADFYKILHIF